MRRVDYRTDKLAQLQQCFPNPAQIIDLHLGTKLRTSGICSEAVALPMLHCRGEGEPLEMRIDGQTRERAG